MKRRYPTSDKSRLKQLTTIAANRDQATQNGSLLLPESQAVEVETLIQSFTETLGNRDQAEYERRKAATERDQRVDRLEILIRNFWNMIHHRVKTGVWGTASFSLYNLAASGNRPRLKDDRDKLNAAQRLIEGDIEAEARGLPKMADPSREDLQAQLELAVTAIGEVEKADMILKESQKRLKTLRSEINFLIRKVANLLKVNLLEEEPATRRRTMRTFGYRFENESIQEVEPEAEPETETPTEA